MKYFTKVGDAEREFWFERKGGRLLAHVDGRVHDVDVALVGDGTAFSMLVDGASHDVVVEFVEGGQVVQYRGVRTAVEVLDERERAAKEVAGAKPGGPLEVCAVMPGVVVQLNVAEGDVVEAGQTLVVLEAMKMQNPLKAEAAGVVTRVATAVGDAVAGGAVLVEIDAGDGE